MLKNLQFLDVSYNNLTELPRSIQSLDSLRFISFLKLKLFKNLYKLITFVSLTWKGVLLKTFKERLGCKTNLTSAHSKKFY